MKEELLAVAREAVGVASDMIRSRSPGRITEKGDRDMATEVDFAVEETVRSFLGSRTPHIGFFGEENGDHGQASGGLSWILDPVDGTANFARGIPLVGVSLGLKKDGDTLLGVIELPFLDEKYWAWIEDGAYADGEKMSASQTRNISNAIVSLGDFAVGPEAESKNSLRFAITELLGAKAQRVRMLGSAATDLAWVARGRLDACVILANKPWDTAAGVLIAREAGAVVIDRGGANHTADSDSTIAVAPGLAEHLMKIIGEVNPGQAIEPTEARRLS